MPTMPTGFAPAVAPGGYSHDMAGGLMRTDVAGGAPRYALDWDRGVQRFNVTLLLDPGQYSVWVAWFHHVIKKGAIAFDMPLDSGFGVQQHVVNIVPDSVSATQNDTFWIISFVVEGESKVYEMTEADAVALIDLHNLTGGKIGDLVERIDKFANADTNALDY